MRSPDDAYVICFQTRSEFEPINDVMCFSSLIADGFGNCDVHKRPITFPVCLSMIGDPESPQAALQPIANYHTRYGAGLCSSGSFIKLGEARDENV